MQLVIAPEADPPEFLEIDLSAPPLLAAAPAQN